MKKEKKNNFNSEKPLVSLIIPVYRVERYLEKCLNSVVGQTYRNLEIILVDDGSPDGCGRICDEYAERDPRVQVIHQENRGLSEARNAGLRRCTGELVGFLDSDDWAEPDMVEKQLKAMREHNADACRCRFRLETESGEVIGDISSGLGIYSGEEMIELIVRGEAAHVVWNTLWRRELFLSGFAFPPGRNFEDTAAICKLYSKCGRVIGIPDAEIHKLERKGSILRTVSLKNYCDRVWAIRELYDGVTELYCAKVKENSGDVARWEELRRIVQAYCVDAVAVGWRQLYSFGKDERMCYSAELAEMVQFVREHRECWSACTLSTRLTIPFMLHDNPFTIALCYYLNQAYGLVSMRRQRG